MQSKIAAALSSSPRTAEQIAQAIGAADAVETVYLVLEHLAANKRAKIVHAAEPGATTFSQS